MRDDDVPLGPSWVWDDAYEVGRVTYRDDLDPAERGTFASGFADGAEWGAGWAFAIIGMAQAIAARVEIRIEPQ